MAQPATRAGAKLNAVCGCCVTTSATATIVIEKAVEPEGGAMDIQVITSGHLGAQGRFAWPGAAPLLARRDLDALKPALVYGTHSTLRSGNFLHRAWINETTSRLRMPLQGYRMVGTLLQDEEWRSYVVDRGDITESDLLTTVEAATLMQIFQSSDSADATLAGLERLGEDANWRVEDAIRATGRALISDRERLFDPELQLAMERGVLSVRPICDDEPESWLTVGDMLAGTSSEEYRLNSLRAVVELLRDPSNAICLDAEMSEFAHTIEQADPHGLARADEYSVYFLAQLPRVKTGSVAELLDLRESELSESLIRFRSAMVRLASEFEDSDLDSADTIEFLSMVKAERIDPALIEMSDLIRQNTYLAQLLTVEGDPANLALQAGALAIAFAAGPVSMAAALAGSIGVGIPALKAEFARRREEALIKTNPFYLIRQLS